MADIDVINEAKRILASYGTDAHTYIAGIGNVGGYDTRNYTNLAGTTPAALEQTIAYLGDVTGGIDANQPTSTNRLLLRQETGGQYYWLMGTATVRWILPLSIPITDIDNYTVIAGLTSSSITSGQDFYSQTADVSNPLLKVGMNAGGTLSHGIRNDAGVLTQAQTNQIVNNQVVVSTYRKTPTVVEQYEDLVKSSASNTTNPPATFTKSCIGGRLTTTGAMSNPHTGKLYVMLVIQGIVSDADLRSLQSYVSLLSGGSIPPIEPTGITYKLTCESGSYSVTGQPATFKKVSHLTGTKGHYVVTGKTALLRRGHSLICAAGSYAITGRDAKLKRGYKALAETGSYAVAGQDVLLRISHKLTCETGSYLIEGQDAVFEYFAGGDAPKHFTLACAKGAYLTSGKPATLKRARTFKCDAGSYAITGKPLLFKFARKMPSETGHYAVSGNDAQFKHAHQLKLSTGVYNVFGKPANLIHVSGGQINYNLLCLAGSYLYQGKNAKLLHKTKSAKCGIYLEAYQPKTTINATQPNYQIIKEC